MKKLVCLVFLAAIVLFLAAQTAKEEAMQSLDNAKKFIQQDNFPKAQDEINFASSKISEILSEQLVVFLPDAPAGFKVEEKSASGMGQVGAILGSANAVAAVGRYQATKENSSGDLPEITLTISMGGILGQAAGLAAMGQMFSGMGMGTNSKAIRVGGYSGTQEVAPGSDSVKLTVQVGNKISVLAEGNSLSNPDILKTLVEKIDLAKLEKSF